MRSKLSIFLNEQSDFEIGMSAIKASACCMSVCDLTDSVRKRQQPNKEMKYDRS